MTTPTVSRMEEKEKELKRSSARRHTRVYAIRVYVCIKIIRATYVHGYAIRYSECTKCTRTPGRVRAPCTCERAVGCRVRDRACACTDALHNIFAIVKCKAPARGSPAEPAFPRAAFAHRTAPQFCAERRRAAVCEGGRRERYGCGKSSWKWGEMPRKQVFVFSCKSRRSQGD